MSCSLITYRQRIGQFNLCCSYTQTYRCSKPYRHGSYFSKECKRAVVVLLLYLLCSLTVKWSAQLCIHGVICQGDYVSGQEGLHVNGISQCQTNRETNITKMFYTVSFVFSWLSKLEMNKMAHIVYGNRQNFGKGITCVYWNKGPSFLKNKRQDIKQII